eukprot:4663862-Alexandrium_andersonii.AAC.1
MASRGLRVTGVPRLINREGIRTGCPSTPFNFFMDLRFSTRARFAASWSTGSVLAAVATLASRRSGAATQ